MEINEIIETAKSKDEDVAREAIFKIGELGIISAKPLLIELLDSPNSSIRDAAAISLGDIKADDAVPKILDLIKNPINKNNIGSLIFALQKLNVKDHFITFVNLIGNSSIEVREMSLNIIEDYVEEIPLIVKIEALKILNKIRENCLEDNSENGVKKYVEYSIELLGQA